MNGVLDARIASLDLQERRIETRRRNAEKRSRNAFGLPAQPETYLKCWGRVRSGAITLAHPLSQLKRMSHLPVGDARTSVEVCIVAAYVESVEGFERARPALDHAYARELDPEAFPLCGPGVPKMKALLELGWAEHSDRPAAAVCGLVCYEFWWLLACRMREMPLAKWKGPTIAPVDVESMEASTGPVTPNEREQMALLKGIEAARKKGRPDDVDKMMKRLGALRAFAVERLAR
jgi:hypothetical protein